MEKESVNLGNAFDLGDIPKVRKVTGARKAAILLITLGADVAADIVKNLPDQYIQKIGVEISNIHKVGTRERREILFLFLFTRLCNRRIIIKIQEKACLNVRKFEHECFFCVIIFCE